MFGFRLTSLLNAVIIFSLIGSLIIYLQTPYIRTVEHLDVDDQLDGFTSKTVSISYTSKGFATGKERRITSPLSRDQIISAIEFLNENYEVLNTDKFGPAHEARTIIVVQVHKRIEYLNYLISTLERANGIEDTLLVFSHDYSSTSINSLIRSIRFCMVN
ncbi:hypothetical protein AB6A40_011588 [Gnathostoma spinigerum]|uniref:Alpha-1,6-mannosyl-glycoprotein 2-beta-N-acetylglucosaminyltransferase n=1 Tax=Gnathostoma spinigerum TaxID=75299 RepID=A0ABD6F218_9BILA